MKKIFSLAMFAVMAMFAGIFLSSCSGAKYMLSISFDEPELVYATVEVDGQSVQANIDGAYDTYGDSKVRVKFFAKQSGIDMRNLVVKANDTVRKIQTFNTNYDGLHADGDLYYGYINFGYMDQDVEISVSGAKGYQNSFTFESVASDTGNEIAAERMQNASIKLPGQSEFQPMSEFMSGENKTISFNMLGSATFDRTFQMKFEGGNPYYITAESPFQIRHADNSLTELAAQPKYERGRYENGDYESGIYTFDLGDVGEEDNLKLVTNFGGLECNKFNFNLPKPNMTYDVSLNKDGAPDEETENFLSFETEGTITITKKMESVTFDKEALRAYLNDLELEALPSDESAADEITFVIPKGLTPEKTGGVDSFNFRLEGLTYSEDVVVLKAQTEEAHPVHLIQPEFYVFDEATQDKSSDVVGYDEQGNVVTFANKKNVLEWAYDVVDGHYNTPYKLHNYNLKLNGEQQLLNVEEVLTSAEFASQYAAGETIEKTLDNGYVFKATFNAETSKYDKFQLIFETSAETEEMLFTFEDFDIMEKPIKISADLWLKTEEGQKFADDRLEGVEFAISESREIPSDVTWTKLVDKEDVRDENVKYGDVVMFRLRINKDVSEGEFVLADTLASRSWYDCEKLNVNGIRYIVCKFAISDIYFDTPQDVQLVWSAM